MKVLKELEKVEKNGFKKLVVLIEHNGKRFKVRFENSNGTPCGFDYKHSLEAFDANSMKWNSIAEISEISSLMKMEPDSSEYGNKTLEQCGAYDFVEACKKYIKLLID